MMITGGIILIIDIFRVNLFFLDIDIIRSAGIGLLCGGASTFYFNRQQAWERKFKEAEHIK